MSGVNESDATFYAFKGIVQFTAAMILHKADNIADENLGKEKSNINQAVLREIMHIRFNIEKEITVKSLAEQFGYTPNYFSVLLKKETGKMFNEYLKDERMRLAKILIKSSMYQSAKLQNRRL